MQFYLFTIFSAHKDAPTFMRGIVRHSCKGETVYCVIYRDITVGARGITPPHKKTLALSPGLHAQQGDISVSGHGGWLGQTWFLWIMLAYCNWLLWPGPRCTQQHIEETCSLSLLDSLICRPAQPACNTQLTWPSNGSKGEENVPLWQTFSEHRTGGIFNHMIWIT